MSKPRILFICTHNSARSQIAEAYLDHLAGDRYEVSSAGFDPGPLNPLAVRVMAEEGLDISGNQAQSVFDLYRDGRLFDFVITVCRDAHERDCPVFPGITRRLHWPFPDLDALSGGQEEKLAAAREIRDRIKQMVREWLEEIEDAA
jgi:arsenate reductase